SPKDPYQPNFCGIDPQTHEREIWSTPTRPPGRPRVPPVSLPRTPCGSPCAGQPELGEAGLLVVRDTPGLGQAAALGVDDLPQALPAARRSRASPGGCPGSASLIVSVRSMRSTMPSGGLVNLYASC